MHTSRAVEADGHLAIRMDDRRHAQASRKLAHLFTGLQIVLYVNLAKRHLTLAEIRQRRGTVRATGFRIDQRFSHLDTALGGSRPLRVGRAAMRIVSTAAAPKPVAAYSQAVESNGFIFSAGQVGVDPSSDQLAAGLEAQAEQVFRNLTAVLEAAGSSFDRVVKVNIYLVDMQQFGAVNAIYERYVRANRPARTTVACGALPRGAMIEVDLIATTDRK